jgi:hypothetical protein
LGNAIAERPVLGEDLDAIDEDVFRPYARINRQVVDHLAIERLFLFDRAGVVGADLDHDQIVAAADAEIVLAEQKSASSCSEITIKRSSSGTSKAERIAL